MGTPDQLSITLRSCRAGIWNWSRGMASRSERVSSSGVSTAPPTLSSTSSADEIAGSSRKAAKAATCMILRVNRSSMMRVSMG